MLLNHYISRLVLQRLVVFILIIFAILWFTQVINFLELSLKNSVPFKYLLQFTLFALPKMLTEVSVVSVFIVVLVTIIGLKNHQELVVINVIGYSPIRQLYAFLLPVLYVISFCYFNNFYLTPSSLQDLNQIKRELKFNVSDLEVNSPSAVEIGRFKYHVGELLPDGSYKDVIIVKKDELGEDIYRAKRAFIHFADNKLNITLFDGSRQSIDSNFKLNTIQFDSISNSFDLKYEEKATYVSEGEAYIWQLLWPEHYPDLISSANHLKFRTAGWKMIIFPLLNLISVLLPVVILLQSTNPRGRNYKEIFICVLLFILSIGIVFFLQKQALYDLKMLYIFPISVICFIVFLCSYFIIKFCLRKA